MADGWLTKAFWLVCLALALVLVGYYLPFLTGAQAFYQSDLTYYFEPFTRFICDAYLHGRLPLWNPYLYCGMSQIAVPSPGMFYPLIVAFMWLKFSQGLSLYLVLHQLIAGIGAFLLVASLGWGVFAAAFAACAVALCGYMFALQANFTLVATVAWLPLLIFGLHQIDGSFSLRNLGYMALTSCAMGLMVGVGRPELSVPAALIAGAFCLGVRLTGRSADVPSAHRPFRQLLFRFLALFLGGLLAAPVLLPALEWARLSPRANGLDLRWVLMWSANWYDCLGMVCAQPVGDLTRLGNKYLNMVASRLNAIPYVTSTYLGPVVFTFAIWGLTDKRWRARWLVLLLFAASLLMALGQNTPVAPFICKLSPAFAAFRYPVKLMIFPMMAVIVLSARGVSISSRREISTAQQIGTAVFWGLLLLTGIVFMVTPGLSQLTLQFPWIAKEQVNMATMQSAQFLFGESFAIAAAVGLIVCAAYFAVATNALPVVAFAVGMIVLLIGNLLWPAFAYLQHGTVSDFYERTPPLVANVLSKLAPTATERQSVGNVRIPQRALALFFDPLTPGLTFLHDQNLNFQQGFYLYARHLLLPNNNVAYGVPYSFGYEAAEVGQFKTIFSDALGSSTQNRGHDPKFARSDAPIARFCQITGTALASTQYFRDKADKLVPKLDPRFFDLVYEDMRFNVRQYRPKVFLPRAYFADTITKTTWDDFYRHVQDLTSDSMLNTTYVEEDIRAEQSSDPSMPLTSQVRFESDDPQSVRISTKNRRAALLVLSDQDYPGWHATIDGADTKLYRVNFFARGVWIPAGSHIVEFTYRPMSLVAGFICFVAVMAAYALVFLGLILLPPGRGVATRRPLDERLPDGILGDEPAPPPSSLLP